MQSFGAYNLFTHSADFSSGWSIDHNFTKDVGSDGFATLSANVSGISKNQWARVVSDTKIMKSQMGRGIVVSVDFMCDSLDAFDNKRPFSIRTFNSDGTVKLGYAEPRLENFSGETPADGSWVRIWYFFDSDSLTEIDASGHTEDELSYATVSLALPRNGSIHYRRPMLELGSVAHAWAPAKGETWPVS